MKTVKLFLLMVLLANCCAYAQGDEMKTYTFVLLKKGPDRTQDSLTVQEIQKNHLAHIGMMAEKENLDVAGPFLDNGDLRGILIFNSTDTARIKSLVEADPAVKSGRLSYEMHPWMTRKGNTFK